MMIDYTKLSLEQLIALARAGDEKAKQEIKEFQDWRKEKKEQS